MEEEIVKFATTLSNETQCPYEEVYASVQLLCMDGKLQEAQRRYQEDSAHFLIWVSKVLQIINFKLTN